MVELVPPAVRTGLGGTEGGHEVAVEDFCAAVLERVVKGEVEDGFEMSEKARGIDRMEQAQFVCGFISRSQPKLVERSS